jgi:3',5'-nucleoside bisphosphate phosphatase
MRIDLHTHSTASDGTFSPAEVITAAVAAGLDVVALTDHDTTAGWPAAVAALPPGLTLVRGAEVSCRWYGVDPSAHSGSRTAWGGPERASIGLHLLAYLFDPAEPALAEELRRVREAREHRAERMVELLRADGVELTWEEVLGYANGGTIGRPHLARALVGRGLVGSVGEAFQSQWLGQRYRVPKQDIEVFRAVELILGAGGVPVFAHPAASVRGRIVPDSLIVELAAAGLAGLEADHEDHTPGQRAQVRALAGELGLLVTGSSDFHGTNKTVQLGAYTTAAEAYHRIVELAHGVPLVSG